MDDLGWLYDEVELHRSKQKAAHQILNEHGAPTHDEEGRKLNFNGRMEDLLKALEEEHTWRHRAMSDAKNALAEGNSEAAWCALNRHEENHRCEVCSPETYSGTSNHRPDREKTEITTNHGRKLVVPKNG